MHNNIKNLIIAFIIPVLFTYCSPALNSKKVNDEKVVIRVDTIQGYFLYEVNVPLKCYTRFDQIEQGNNLIFFDSLMLENEISELYKKGVFIYEYQPIVDRYIQEKKIGISQRKEAVRFFDSSINYFFHKDDILYNRTLYNDKKAILSYKKIYAKFTVVALGSLKQLVPNLVNYKCCYSNTSAIINSFFITDILEFKMY